MGIYIDKRNNRLFIQFRLRGEIYKERLPAGTTRETAEDIEAAVKNKMLRKRHKLRDPNEIGTVYLIEAVRTRQFKIGFTSLAPEKRLAALQNSTPVILVLRATRPGTLALEKALHFHFRHDRIKGEWFNLGSNAIGAFLAWEESDARRDIELYMDERLERGRYKLVKRNRPKIDSPHDNVRA